MVGKLKQKKAIFIRIIKNYGKKTLKNVLLSKRFHLLFKASVASIILVAVLYGGYLYINRSVGNDVVVSKSEIIARVGKLTSIPNETPDAVVRVEDPEILKKQHVFYENVKTGDYILMYPNVAIIYDLMNNVIVSKKDIEK
jgi:hypothetical protein